MSNRTIRDRLHDAFFARSKADLATIVQDAEKDLPAALAAASHAAEEDGNGNGNGNGNGGDDTEHKEPDGDEGEHSGHVGGVHVHIEHSAKDKGTTEDRLQKCEDGLLSLDKKMGRILDHLGVTDEDQATGNPPAKPSVGEEVGALTSGGPGPAEPEIMEADPALKTGRSQMGDAAYTARKAVAWRNLVQDTRARAEVLSPGIKFPTLDAAPNPDTEGGRALCGVRREALTKAMGDEHMREVIGSYLSPDSVKTMSCDAIRQAFMHTSDAVRRANNAAGRPTPHYVADTNPRTAFDTQSAKLKAINTANREFWQKQGGLGPHDVH